MNRVRNVLKNVKMDSVSCVQYVCQDVRTPTMEPAVLNVNLDAMTVIEHQGAVKS